MADPAHENPGFSIAKADDYEFAVAHAWEVFADTGDQQPLIDLGVLSQEWPLIEDEEND